jgi:asparagine synthase (glutamine-hydrolysing)
MCGIAGIVHHDRGRPVAPRLLRAMCDVLAHRGPDDFGQHLDGHVGIGMRRLSIIDLQSGRQPIANEDGTVQVVFNGEIYNYRALRQELIARGHRLRTTGDTEVIAHLYEEQGEGCVERLRGMFAFAVWDARDETLMLARDRMGIKPLYYAEVPAGLVFASELKGLLAHPEVGRDVDPQAVAEYFRYSYVPGDLCVLDGVRKLPAAHVLTFREGRLRVARYWRVQPEPDHSRPEAAWNRELGERLGEAVESHLVSDVPVGAFLSGGLDSGAMVALMARASTGPIRTFTVGFATPTGTFDEREPARAVARRYATRHHECLLEADVTAVLPRIVRAFDEPFADSSAVPNFLVCRETARHVKVALSGLGADELFGGYERYAGLELGERYRRLPRLARRALSAVVGGFTRGATSSQLGDRLRRFVGAAEMTAPERYRSFINVFSKVPEVLRSDVREEIGGKGSEYDRVVDGLSVETALDLALFADLSLYLPDDLLTLTDRISMAHSLEVRVPFLDHELVEFVARMPARLKVRGLRKKVLFRRVIEPLLPSGHLRRPKQGFSVPMAEWLRGTLRPLVSDLVTSRACRESPWLDHVRVGRLVDEHLAGRANHEVRVWAIVCFLEWQRQYAGAPATAMVAA